jgi:peptidoglycan-N-acetylglucosamine deacetylase
MINMKSKTGICLVLAFAAYTATCLAQSYDSGAENQKPVFRWPAGKKMALSLTFDDARLSQIDTGIPLLDKHNVKATFYVSPSNMLQRVEGWKKAVASGHDIGNHTLRHPCTGNFSWSKDKALEDYTLDAMNSELDSANKLIVATLGIRPVSFAYPCGQTYTGRGIKTRSYVPLIAELFETGREWLSEGPNDPSFCDLSQLMGMELDGKTPEQVIRLIEDSKNKGSWLILAGHEMNLPGNQTSLLNTIDAICRYANDTVNGVWIDNVHNIAAYVKASRRNR